MEQITATLIDSHELDKLVQENVPDKDNYESREDCECSSSGCRLFTARKVELSDSFGWTHQYINHLCWLGLIPEGNIVLDLSW